MYTLVAIDMDGTLLTDEKTILPETLEALALAKRRGLRPVICTGRGFAELAPYPELLPLIDFYICTSGSVIRAADGTLLRQRGLEKETVSRVLAAAGSASCLVHLLTAEHSLVPAGGIERLPEVHMGAYTGLYRRCAEEVSDIRAAALESLPLPKINLYFETPEERIRMRELLSPLPVTMAFSETTSLEITPPGIDKGSGLLCLAKHLGLPAASLAAVGDSQNDIPMLLAAGLPAAMGNAAPEVMERASLLLPGNNEDGVGALLRRLLTQDSPLQA